MAKVVAGNWKMNHGPTSAQDFFARFNPRVESGHVRLVLFPPAVTLPSCRAHRSSSLPVELGAQNIHWEPSGAFTGETSAEMARDAGASLVLVGHSERRHVFGETDEEVDRKVRAANRAGLTPVVCVGELLEERRAGRLEETLLRQVGAVAESLSAAAEFMIAYEPVWAIGTGETATPEDASEAHGVIRTRLAELGPFPVLYGGSVSPDNAGGLMNAGEVDGVLVGGASLDPERFARIAEAAGVR